MINKRKDRNYWSFEKCVDDAKNFKSRKEWQIKSSSAYSVARKNKWIDNCCKHMK
jgi:hypothetical protein